MKSELLEMATRLTVAYIEQSGQSDIGNINKAYNQLLENLSEQEKSFGKGSASRVNAYGM